MKRNVFLVIVAMLAGIWGHAQTIVDFEELTLAPDSFWNGSDLSGGFTSKGVYFVNYYDTSWSAWSGFAYSNQTDTVTAGYSNQYSTIAGSGADNSSNFALMYVSPYNGGNYLKLTSAYSNGSTVEGFYITNNTYAYISMRDGDAYAKKFGGDTGDDPDWFKLTVTGYLDGAETGSEEFYLADYRFADNDSDYIVKDWTWFDLTGLGTVDSLTFALSSSDTGTYGMNTPAYFCMDNLTLSESFNGIVETGMPTYSVFPNPVVNTLYVNQPFEKAEIYNANGQKIKEISHSSTQIDFSMLQQGVYLIRFTSHNRIYTTKVVK